MEKLFKRNVIQQQQPLHPSTLPGSLSIQRPRCAPSFLLTECLSTFSALVEHTRTARSSLIKKKNSNIRTNTRKLVQEVTVFPRSPYVHRSAPITEHTVVYTVSMKNTEGMHSFQIRDAVAVVCAYSAVVVNQLRAFFFNNHIVDYPPCVASKNLLGMILLYRLCILT